MGCPISYWIRSIRNRSKPQEQPKSKPEESPGHRYRINESHERYNKLYFKKARARSATPNPFACTEKEIKRERERKREMKRNRLATITQGREMETGRTKSSDEKEEMRESIEEIRGRTMSRE